MSGWRRDPLVRFLALGAAIVLVDLARADRGEIEVNAALVSALERELALDLGRPPTAAELRARVDRHVEDEALYREAKARGFADDDPVIRRRLVQLMRAALEVEAPAAVTGAPVPVYDLDHVFFGAAAPASWREALAAGQRVGQAFPLGDRLTGDAAAITAQLGPTVGERLGALAPGEWVGPLRSPFGEHALRLRGVSSVPGARPPPPGADRVAAVVGRYAVRRVEVTE